MEVSPPHPTAPLPYPSSLALTEPYVLRVCVFVRSTLRESEREWAVEDTLSTHTDWVRDVAWAPNIGLPTSYIASCSQDRTVLIHTRPSPTAAWQTTSLLPEGETFPEVVWRVSWSLAGNVLAVSGGDGKVSLWKEKGGNGGGWECVSEMSS